MLRAMIFIAGIVFGAAGFILLGNVWFIILGLLTSGLIGTLAWVALLGWPKAN